jgi:hypothetical protein
MDAPHVVPQKTRRNADSRHSRSVNPVVETTDFAFTTASLVAKALLTLPVSSLVSARDGASVLIPTHIKSEFYGYLPGFDIR